MSVGKATIRLAKDQVLTASFADTSYNGATSVSEESIASLEIHYTTGTGETTSVLEFKILHSFDQVDWAPESLSSIAASSDTLTTLTHKIAGGIGETKYSAQYVIPLCSRNFKVQVKENGVSSNFGTVSISLTQAAGSGQSRNIQSSGSSSGSDVNLAEVGGSTVSLGQKTMANSMPVVISSDQSTLPVTDANLPNNLNSSVFWMLRQVLRLLKPLGIVSTTSNRLSVDVNSGAVTATVTFAANQDIRNITGSVASLTNIANIGGVTAFVQEQNIARGNYASGIRNNLNFY